MALWNSRPPRRQATDPNEVAGLPSGVTKEDVDRYLSSQYGGLTPGVGGGLGDPNEIAGVSAGTTQADVGRQLQSRVGGLTPGPIGVSANPNDIAAPSAGTTQPNVDQALSSRYSGLTPGFPGGMDNGEIQGLPAGPAARMPPGPPAPSMELQPFTPSDFPAPPSPSVASRRPSFRDALQQSLLRQVGSSTADRRYRPADAVYAAYQQFHGRGPTADEIAAATGNGTYGLNDLRLLQRLRAIAAQGGRRGVQ